MRMFLSFTSTSSHVFLGLPGLSVLCLYIADLTDHGIVITQEVVQCIYLHGPCLSCMLSTTNLWSKAAEKGKQLGDIASSTFAAYDRHQLAAESMSPRQQNSRTTSSFSLPTSTSASLKSIGRAAPSHRAHLNSGSGCKGPLMALHFLCTQRSQPPQKIALLPPSV